MKIYVQKQIQSLYTPTEKKQSIKFNIIKQKNNNTINHIHGETINDKGKVLKINLKKYKISNFREHVKNNSSYKLNSNEVYKIYDESKIKRISKSLKTKPKTVDKKKKSSTKTSKTVDKKKKSSDKKAIIKKKSKISKK